MFLKGQYFLFQLSVLGFMQTLFPLAVLANCHCYYHSSVLFYFTVRYFFYTIRYFVLYITVQIQKIVMLCRVIADHILMVLSSIISINANWCLFCKKWENYFHRFATFASRICLRNWSFSFSEILINSMMLLMNVLY